MKHLSLFALLMPLILYGQVDSAAWIKYTPEFDFAEGVYLNFDQVKTNSPLPKSRIVSNLDYSDNNFFERVLGQKKVYYYDNIGNKQWFSSNKIWGYSRNGFLFIAINDGFYRVTLVGNICHFVAYYTYYNSNYSNPYYYNSYDPYLTVPSHHSTSTEMRQYLLDMETGQIMDYDVEGLEALLMKDTELFDQYNSLSKKKKKQLKFMYIRKYNERNPLYFPNN